jgi:hypothetical protein
MSKPSLVLPLLALTALYFLASSLLGSWDYESALMIEADYCDRLRSGAHSDYDNLRAVCAQRHWGK